MVRIPLPDNKIRDYCARWNINEMALFGSVLRDDFNEKSDVDVLVTFKSDAVWTIFDHVDMQTDLETILGRKVDLLVRKGIERSSNYIRRKEILESAEVVYAAA